MLMLNVSHSLAVRITLQTCPVRQASRPTRTVVSMHATADSVQPPRAA